ncbi:MAG TPA: arsenate reductase ArsC [Bdellovibrionota bacterium]|nr:arsenate reductase ArsC [Bdellovibrionota bacterium]
MKKVHLLFLCTGNSIRSQIAEGYARYFGQDRFEVMSAGVSPSGIHPLTMQVMREDAVDIAGQWSKSVYDLDLSHLEYLVTVCGSAKEKCPALPSRVRQEHWPIEDPIGVTGTDRERMEKFRAVRDEIRARVKDLLARLTPATVSVPIPR